LRDPRSRPVKETDDREEGEVVMRSLSIGNGRNGAPPRENAIRLSAIQIIRIGRRPIDSRTRFAHRHGSGALSLTS
jgi:hypothetical protein